MQFIEIFLYSLIFCLLIIGVVQDIRTRNVQRWVSIPFGLIAIALLILHEEYLFAGFVFLALYLPRNGIGQLFLILASVLLMINIGIGAAMPLLVGLLLSDLLGRLGWYLHADIAFLFPLYGLCHDWYIFAWLTGLILSATCYLNYKRYRSWRNVFNRIKDVAKMMWKGQTPDETAIRTPALVLFSIGTFGYFFIFPGYFLHSVITVLANL